MAEILSMPSNNMVTLSLIATHVSSRLGCDCLTLTLPRKHKRGRIPIRTENLCRKKKSEVRFNMPTYVYRCEHCGHGFEKFQKFSDAPVEICPECDQKSVRKVLQPTGLQFKGSGWYITDSRASKKSNNGKIKSKSDAKPSTDSKSSSESTSSKSESSSSSE